MADARPRRRRPSGPPVQGWAFGAEGLPRGFWAVLAVLLLALAVWLLVTAYYGYAVVIAVLAIAAAVNLLP
ncbi:MAG: hypothetical protein MUE51_05200 [Thermoleophilia bacterium]|nr:hypothetical protein [Thermoleophilia bacterium]